MYKLVCVDLDGTLLDSHQQVSSVNKEAIRKALNQGIEVAIVSGRPNCFTTRIINQIDPRMGHITFNGAYYRIGDKTNSFPIRFDTVKAIASIAQKYNIRMYFKNKNLGIVTKSDLGFQDYDQYKEQTAPKDRIDYYYNVDAVAYFEEHTMDVLKIFTRDSDFEGIRKVGEEIKKLPGVHFFDYGEYFEVSSDETSKGKAILKVAAQLNIKPEEIVCIGDHFNDASMFEVAGLSIAMKNAPQKVQEMCDALTLSNDCDGVAYALDTYVLKNKKSLAGSESTYDLTAKLFNL